MRAQKGVRTAECDQFLSVLSSNIEPERLEVSGARSEIFQEWFSYGGLSKVRGWRSQQPGIRGASGYSLQLLLDCAPCTDSVARSPSLTLQRKKLFWAPQKNAYLVLAR
jgi:hypothetical protein